MDEEYKKELKKLVKWPATDKLREKLLECENIQDTLMYIYPHIIHNTQLELMEMIIIEFNFDVTCDNNKPITIFCECEYMFDHFRMVQLLVKYGADYTIFIKKFYENRDNIKHFFESHLTLEHLKILLDWGFDFSVHDSIVLYLICEHKCICCRPPENIDLVKFLVDNCPNLDINCCDGKSLISCVNNFKIEHAKLLLECGANVSCCNDMPIRQAVASGNQKMVQLLLDYGANIKVFENNKFKSNQHETIYEILVSRGISERDIAIFFMNIVAKLKKIELI
ncbi:MAG: hypothetical protein Satyrvirus7_17 [Satyrvirus sp.]|uniref:Uncharacterized protein n=1 Tax=Satyrvirus sp. TaxID=2487771 RepID=A0A3G5AH73_9VIRU|nr:MAG: hypothetical protein Satyrvirus7_17 [Satyrvirus sp.]